MKRSEASDTDAFRAAFGLFATGVAIATCAPAGGRSAGVTINSVTSVSLDPALALFCLEKRSLALPLFLEAGHFALNILPSGQQALSERHARQQELRGAYDIWSSGAPVLPQALAIADCTLMDVYGGGDHVILLGRVLEVGASEEQSEPLLYFNSGYRRIQP